MNKLRDYQNNILEKVLSSEKDQIVCLPTGSGKTVIAAALIESLKKDFLVIFIVPRLELIKQAKNEFGDTDIIWSSSTKIDGNDCIIASKDSILLQMKNINFSKKLVLIFDEVHIGIKQSFKIVQMLKPVRVIGLTATPERMDGKALLKGNDSIHCYGCFDELIQEETVVSLIE